MFAYMSPSLNSKSLYTDKVYILTDTVFKLKRVLTCVHVSHT